MQDAPAIPVIVIRDLAHVVPLARALVAGGTRMLELTLRTPVALVAVLMQLHNVVQQLHIVLRAGTGSTI